MVWGAADVPQLRRPVGGAHDQRHLGLVGLDHRGVELGRGGAARAQRRPPAARGQAEPEGDERGRPLVVEHVQRAARPVGQGQRQRRRARARGRRRRRRTPARTHSSTSVAQNVAAAALGRRPRGDRCHRPIVLHGAGRDLVRRRLPVVLHRQAALRGGPRAASPGATTSTVVFRAFQLDPTRSPGRGHPGRARSTTASSAPDQADQIIDRVTDDGRRGGTRLSPRSGRSGPTPSRPPGAVAGRAAGRPGGREGATAAGLLHRGPQRRRSGRPGRPGRRGRPRPRRGRSTSWLRRRGRAEVAAPTRRRASSASPPCRPTSSMGGGRCPGAQDPDDVPSGPATRWPSWRPQASEPA